MDPSVSPPVQRVLGGIGAHLLQPEIEPRIVVMTKYGAKDPCPVANLKEGRVLGDVVITDNAPEDGDGSNRA